MGKELSDDGINLIVVSIGTTENLRRLVDHLSLSKIMTENLYVDHENVYYDALHLKKGLKETFFSPSTSFSFLKRFTTKDGTKELGEALSKWNKAVYVPPKQDQALYQGGTFIFDGNEKTVFVHYDEGTGAHSDIEQVIDLAKKTTRRNESSVDAVRKDEEKVTIV